eukprot:TRINITY_DN13534_c0_g1_i1.p1 TRINITY_DN13534_c0_g1~~TRINITY_DN13534_c0_g1_i1.p1  ORF type:complete len:336 (-),score=58.30 TRINITY_DN13534_c0_g1_i1:37-924(-)
MAVQYHVAYSSEIMGAGIIAGGPYWCANGNVEVALNACTIYPEYISVLELIAATEYAEGLESIDNTDNMWNDRIWLLSGTLDTIVYPGVVKKLESYYRNYVQSANIATEYQLRAEHSFVTADFGNACDELETPYINNCNYDSAGHILQHIYSNSLRPPVTAKASNILSINQGKFLSWPVSPSTVGLNSIAYAYVPTNCSKGNPDCRVHIAFHGCLQTIPLIGSDFFLHAGYNEWAESNDIIVLYPQAIRNTLNPEGCWDWWGYSGPNYATQSGAQISTVHAMANWIQSAYIGTSQ